MLFPRNVSIKLGHREVKLARHGLARAITAEQARVNRRVALELDGATDWLGTRLSAQLIELSGNHASRQQGARCVRSQRVITERFRHDLARALRLGDVIAEEAPAPPPLTERDEPPPELPPPPPLPRPRPEPEPAPPEPDLPSEQVDQEFQAQTLRAASEQGAPFCEECAKARRGSAGPSPATHAAPEPPMEGAP